MELKKTNKYAHGIDKTRGTEDVFALIFTRWNNGRSVFRQKYYLLCHFSSPTYFIFEILCAPFGWCTIALKVFLLFLSFFCSFCSLFYSQSKRIRNSCAHNSWARPSNIAGDLESEIKFLSLLIRFPRTPHRVRTLNRNGWKTKDFQWHLVCIIYILHGFRDMIIVFGFLPYCSVPGLVTLHLFIFWLYDFIFIFCRK